MTSNNWPATSGDCPQDIAKHASCLKADFDLVSKAVDSSLARIARLPSTLKPSILTGIEKGIAEARKNGYCPKWSKVDQSLFRDVMLKNIAIEAAPQARDRIPLDQFNGLYESYNVLHIKLVAHLPPTATTRQSVGADAPIQATSVGGLVEPSHGTNPAVKLVQASRKPVISRQGKRAEYVIEKKSDDDSGGEGNSGEAKSEDEESEDEESEDEESEDEEREEERKGQDAEDGQAVADNKDSETGSDSSEDSSNGSSSGGEEENEDDG